MMKSALVLLVGTATAKPSIYSAMESIHATAPQTDPCDICNTGDCAPCKQCVNYQDGPCAPCWTETNGQACLPACEQCWPSVKSGGSVILATFDGNPDTTRQWRDTNDPVMGGASTSTFTVDKANNAAVFNGTCAIVKSLSAPGFAKVATQSGGKYEDASSFLDAGIQLYVRSSTPEYQGFKVAFSAPGVPKTSLFGGGSFKAPFAVVGSDWQMVQVPFDTFSYDWSGYTGTCDVKDPGNNGKQHYCCTDAHPEVCPTTKFLSTINSLELWAEGVEGDFHLEVQTIGAGQASTKTLHASN